MTPSETRRTAETLAVGFAIFALAVVLPKLILDGAAPTLAVGQTIELLLSLLAIGLLGRGRFGEYGFRRPTAGYFSRRRLPSLAVAVLVAMGLGASASLAIMFSGAVGNPLVKQLSFLQIVLFVWISSSTIEEVFTRGFLQSHLSTLRRYQVGFPGIRIDLPTLISAAFFGAMHLVLLLSGADGTSTLVIVLFTFSLGLLAGHHRALSGSLVPAIVLHMLANVGGLVGGIIYLLITVATTGSLPSM
jgi:membrane protease YdiL (CAAX protease family)